MEQLLAGLIGIISIVGAYVVVALYLILESSKPDNGRKKKR